MKASSSERAGHSILLMSCCSRNYSNTRAMRSSVVVLQNNVVANGLESRLNERLQILVPIAQTSQVASDDLEGSPTFPSEACPDHD